MLASAPPRRRELLEKLGIRFEVITILAVEIRSEGGSARYLNSDCVVIGADTIVMIDGEILGKPKDVEEAIFIHKRISGRELMVIAGFSIVRPKKEILHREFVESRVKIKSLEPREIEGYIKTKEPMDKVGA